MAQPKHTGFGARSVGFSLAATLAIALFSAAGVARATCTQCTFSLNAGTNSSGTDETGFGYGALNGGPDAGSDNTATGVSALGLNTSGSDNTATGLDALGANTTGEDNTATGVSALENNTSGEDNTAAGLDALFTNTTGEDNTASGYQALQLNNGDDNTATGWIALQANSTGNDNTATGYSALEDNLTGSNNIAVGFEAGTNLSTGSNNIYVGSPGGLAGESNAIRIGVQGTQTATYVAGIFGTPRNLLNSRMVVVSSNGQLGTLLGFPSSIPSSARYKRDIRNMGAASNGLLKLRPVSFRYKQDPAGALQYGLIAEEVERVYPELVTHGDDGKVEGVRYELLPALLLNEVQKQAKENQQQAEQIRILTKQISALKKKDAQIDALAERMNALERQVRLAKPEHLASAMR